MSTGSRIGCRFAFKGVCDAKVFVGLLTGTAWLVVLVVVVGLGCFSSFSQPDCRAYGYGDGEPGCGDEYAAGECDLDGDDDEYEYGDCDGDGLGVDAQAVEHGYAEFYTHRHA